MDEVEHQTPHLNTGELPFRREGEDDDGKQTLEGLGSTEPEG